MAKKHKRTTKRRVKRNRGIGIPLGKWLRGPFRVRKNRGGYLIDLKR